MRTLGTNRSDADLAKELLEIIEQRRAIEKREGELKSYFKTKLNNVGHETANVGGILITLTSRERTDLDKKAMAARLGADFLKQFETKTEYQIIEVKEVAASLLKKSA